MPYDYSKDIGKTLWSRNKTSKGRIVGVSNRYCAGCQGMHSCYIVQWENGLKTKPCTNGVSVEGSDLIIN